jgi:UDP-N-acetylmuramoyl-L-alanyl-D-glutamate--2,6-diaminopimelate ligase
MTLAGLVDLLRQRGQLIEAPTDDAPHIIDVTYDSRRVMPGSLFVALRGQHADGHDHATAAVKSGAVAVIGERPIPRLEVPLAVVRDARASLPVAAAWHTGFPSRHLGVVGITGTDGKTTTAYLVRALLEAFDRPTGLISTTDVIIAGASHGNAARATTPEAPELQAYLAAMRDEGDLWAIVESTSHGLAQQRVGEVAYDVAVLTNVSQEHLDFHGSLDAYRAAKRSLFSRLEAGPVNPEKGFGKHAVVNADDPEAASFVAAARAAGASVVRYGLSGKLGDHVADVAADVAADVVATDLVEDSAAMHVSVRTPDWEGVASLRLAGRFNVHNALAAISVAHALGLDAGRAAAALGSLQAVPGRMQRVDLGQPFTVVVDYAHTAESLAKVLDELAPPSDGDAGLVAVFGSAGERDTQKRPAMGRVAGERCRLVILTDEDPRREDPGSILDAIAKGAEAAGKRRGEDLLVIADRAEAIAEAISRAHRGDCVLLAGKGHERTIETADGDLPWDEVGVAIDALRALGYGTDSEVSGP